MPRQTALLRLIMIVVVMTLPNIFLVSCNAVPLHKKASVSLDPPKVSAAEFAGLKVGLSTDLDEIGTKTFIESRKRKMFVSEAPIFKTTILKYERDTPTAHTLRPDLLQACQFIAVRIELDQRIETAEWLVTTKGQGACHSSDDANPQNYWMIMHTPGHAPEVIASGRAKSIQLWRKGQGELLKRFEAIKSNNVKGVEILCYQEYKSQGKRYVPATSRTEGYIFTPQIPEKTWQPVDEHKYQCRP